MAIKLLRVKSPRSDEPFRRVITVFPSVSAAELMRFCGYQDNSGSNEKLRLAQNAIDSIPAVGGRVEIALFAPSDETKPRTFTFDLDSVAASIETAAFRPVTPRELLFFLAMTEPGLGTNGYITIEPACKKDGVRYALHTAHYSAGPHGLFVHDLSQPFDFSIMNETRFLVCASITP